MKNNKGKRKHKPLEELTLMDRFLFDLVMSEPQNIQDALSLIFNGREISPIHVGLSEKKLEPYYDSRAVRLDLLAFDADHVVYDAEAQKQNIGNRAMRRRSRLYQAYIDVNLLEPGITDYGHLNDVYVIFISPFDLFGLKKYMYTFRMKCDEDADTILDDGAVRIYLNTRGENDSEVPESLIEFLHYMEKTSQYGKEIKNPRVKRLAERVEQLKSSQKVSVKYMMFSEIEARIEARMEGLEEGREEGREEGQYIQLIKMVCRKLQKGKNENTIADELDEDIGLITKVCQAAAQAAPNYDCDEIYNLLNLDKTDDNEIDDETYF